MDIIEFKENSSQFKRMISSSLERKSLIPIIGSGFTCGSDSLYKTVPDGKELKEIMIEAICKNSLDITKNDFNDSNYEFSEIADEYFKHVPKQEYKRLLRGRFTKVVLSKEKKDFLKSGWPYIYTLNIDDGIEGNSEYTPILPYKKISQNITKEYLCVYKMHGDVLEEIIYDDIPNVIFSSAQYIKSLGGNSSILELFQSDYISNNILFVGCSLHDELDLNYAIKTIDDSLSLGSKKIYVTRSQPTGLRKSKLERFGIDTVIVVENYDVFYNAIYEWSQEVNVSDFSKFDEFKNPQISILTKNLKYNQKYIVDIIGSKSSDKSLPYYNVPREITEDIIINYKSEPFTIVAGKRFSGKTFIAKHLALRIIDSDVFLFPSVISISNSELDDLSRLENSVFIFDTNSLNFENILHLEKIENILEKNHNNFILFSNKNDSLFMSIVSKLTQNNFYEVINKLNHIENDSMNKKLSEIGLISSLAYKTLMDNYYRYNNAYDDDFPSINSMEISDDYLALLMLIATDSKVYSVITHMLNIKRKTVDDFVSDVSPFVEFSSSLGIEIHQHSGFKIILNSPAWVFQILGHEKHETKRIVKQIVRIVNILKGKQKFSFLYKKLIGFDNFNQFFPQRDPKLIFTIYESLEAILFDDSQYWLQRAKSILHLRRTDIEMLKLAINYAKKAFYDTSYHKKLRMNSTTTLAFLYGRLAKEQNYTNRNSVGDAINWYYSAIIDRNMNKRHIDGMIKRGREKNDFNGLIRNIINGDQTNFLSTNPELRRKAEYLATEMIIKT